MEILQVKNYETLTLSMRNKHILIVDDEQNILAVLKNALRKMEPTYQITTASDGFIALDRLQEKTFDLVITDFNMQGMDGLELVEAIHYQQPQAKIIMITAYGYEGIEEDIARLRVFRYLAKPLEIKTLRQVVVEALMEATTNRPSIFMISNEQYDTIHKLLKQLQTDINGRCIFLTTTNGDTVARMGDTGKIAVESLASVLSASLVSLLAAGRVLDKSENTVNLAYHEGKNEFLYALNIGETMLLIIIIDRTAYSSRLGSVWYYTQQAALNLNKTLQDTSYTRPEAVFSETMESSFDDELDKLWGN